jgi:rsbT co-antagonist protein RsbR
VPLFSATSCRPPWRRGDGQFEDITAPIWDQCRSELEDISRSRATLRLTPAFVFSLKEPQFALLREKIDEDPHRLAEEIWRATLLLD